VIASANPFKQWLDALEARHLSELRFAEATRALRALSSAYVQRRNRLREGGALDTAGKRAAFALFYGPLHWLTTEAVVRALDASHPPLESILDLGCGTGAAGAAWALAAPSRPRVMGIDRHPWAVEEALWTYRVVGVRGTARRGDLARSRLPGKGGAVLAAFAVNELEQAARAALKQHMIEASSNGARVLIIEPISRAVTPWWDEWAAVFTDRGGRADEWRMAVELPSLVKRLDDAAGLDHRVMTARSLWLDASK
jgi:SAM-dependent methyltransferase